MSRAKHSTFAQRVFGPPMAGPEKRLQHWLRQYLIAGLTCLAALTFFASELSSVLGDAYAVVTLSLMLSLIACGIIWWRTKRDADEAHWNATFAKVDRRGE